MTSTTDTAGHPDVVEISDLTEGLLPPGRSRDVRRHLDACGLCADVYASLEEIQGLLGSAPEPEPMPDDVAQRIDAVLASAAACGVGAGNRTSHVSRETSLSRDHLAERPALPTERPAELSTDRPAGRPRAAAGPGRKGAQRGRRRGRFVLGAVLTAAVLGTGGLLVASFGDDPGHPAAHGTSTASAGAFSGDSVQNQVRALLIAKKGLPQGSEQPRQPSDGQANPPGTTGRPNTLVQTAVPVPDCVRGALHQNADVLAAKTGTYAGTAAYLVVVADARDSERVTAYVVDAACVQQQTGAAGRVLLKQSMARS
ncbi:anti-sigma factor [Streptomyces sp. NRRL S-31]|uniref:anti-sigma factor family protein n=1 Tax=Streptomyces sp. NRRL S-31 TaxID=1463898 RepID=UPI0004CA351F|nr:hypothetical protein [Streptomyces sp. NRRL S-31]